MRATDGFSDPLAGYTPHPVTLGMSGAEVVRLDAPGKPTLFLKRSGAEHAQARRDEAARLRWLRGKLPVPEPIGLFEDEHGAALVMTAVPGLNLTAFNGESPEVKHHLAEELAGALRRFHALEPYGCPFDHSAQQELGRLDAQLSALEPTPSVQEAFGRLEALRARIPDEDLVPTHGDACLPNVLVVDGRLSGFVDLGAAGLGDRYRDLERALWSLTYNYGPGYDEVFGRAYGVTELDWAKLGFYRELEGFTVPQPEAGRASRPEPD